MSPSMDAARRGSGQRLHVVPPSDRPVEDGRPWKWTCTLCEAFGWTLTFRAAQNETTRHQVQRHPGGAR